MCESQLLKCLADILRECVTLGRNLPHLPVISRLPIISGHTCDVTQDLLQQGSPVDGPVRQLTSRTDTAGGLIVGLGQNRNAHVTLPQQLYSSKHYFGFSGKHSATLKLLTHTYPPLSRARYSLVE